MIRRRWCEGDDVKGMILNYYQASNLTAAPQQFAAVPCRLAAMPCEWNGSLRPDWPCLVSLTSHVEQTFHHLFQMMKWRRHILLSPTRVGGKFTWPGRDAARARSCPRETSSTEIAVKTMRVSLILFYNIRHDFYVKSSAIGQSGTMLTFIQWKPRIQPFTSNHLASKMLWAPLLLITVLARFSKIWF